MAGEDDVPLLEFSRKGSASMIHASGNILVSIVGTGGLGLPYAFKISGWFAGLCVIFLIALLAYYCMMLQVKCRNRLEEFEGIKIATYGDLGEYTCGKLGRYVAETMLIISQFGGCVAYYLFVAQNLSSVFTGSGVNYIPFIYVLIPVELALACIRGLPSLAPISIFADLCNVLAMATIIRAEVISFEGMDRVKYFKGWKSLPFVIGTSVFCFDGFGMILSLEASMKKPEKFGKVLGYTLLLIALIYAGFGFAGYASYGEETLDIVTLNLANDWCALSIKLALSLAVILTCPVLMHPVYELFESKVEEDQRIRTHCGSISCGSFVLDKVFRGISIIVLAVVTAYVPGFGTLVSLMGSTVSALLGFVFPAFAHLRAFRGCLKLPQIVFNVAIICWGVAFAVYGTLMF